MNRVAISVCELIGWKLLVHMCWRVFEWPFHFVAAQGIQEKFNPYSHGGSPSCFFPGRAPRLPEGLPHRPGRAQLTHPVPRDMRLLKAQAYLHTPNEYSMTESFTRRRRTSFMPYTSPSHTQCAPAMLTRLSAALSPLPCWPAARSCLGRSPWLLTGSSRVELPCFQSLL